MFVIYSGFTGAKPAITDQKGASWLNIYRKPSLSIWMIPGTGEL